MGWEELIKLIVRIGVVVLLVGLSYKFYIIFTMSKQSQIDFDFKRIVAEIEDLKSGEEINVPVKGHDYFLMTFPRYDSDDASKIPTKCFNDIRGAACICSFKSEEEGPYDCKAFKTINLESEKIVPINQITISTKITTAEDGKIFVKKFT